MTYQSTAGQHEPAPQPGKQNVADLVMADIQDRVEAGLQKYGTKLQTHNGRDALMDAYQEAIDLVMYLRQAMAERDDAMRRFAVGFDDASVDEMERYIKQGPRKHHGPIV